MAAESFVNPLVIPLDVVNTAMRSPLPMASLIKREAAIFVCARSPGAVLMSSKRRPIHLPIAGFWLSNFGVGAMGCAGVSGAGLGDDVEVSAGGVNVSTENAARSRLVPE